MNAIPPLRLIPVIDLLGGQVVRGVGGMRESYRPIQSQLVSNAEPGQVAQALVNTFHTTELYVADLDAIAGKDPDACSLLAISLAGASLWIDAGSGDADRCQQLLDRLHAIDPPATIVVGLESVGHPSQLAGCVEAIDSARAVFSLDLKNGRPLVSAASAWPSEPLAIAELAIEAGFRRIILLDLAGVGQDDGIPTLALCQKLQQAHPTLEWISGGGVRGPHDLEVMAQHGVDAALVASALHDGRISATTG